MELNKTCSEQLGLAFSHIIGYNGNCFRGVAQVVERYLREVEAASSSLVTPILKKPRIHGISVGSGIFLF